MLAKGAMERGGMVSCPDGHRESHDRLRWAEPGYPQPPRQKQRGGTGTGTRKGWPSSSVGAEQLEEQDVSPLLLKPGLDGRCSHAKDLEGLLELPDTRDTEELLGLPLAVDLSETNDNPEPRYPQIGSEGRSPGKPNRVWLCD